MDKELLSVANESFLISKDKFCADIPNVSLESVLDLVDVPIVHFVKGLSNLGLGIRERNLCRNTIYFLQGFQTENIDEDKLVEYQKKLKADTEFFEREMARIIVILDNTVDAIRARIIGCLYMNQINKRISFQQYCEYCDLTNRLYLSDFSSIVDYDAEIDDHLKMRLASLGIRVFRPEFHTQYDDGNLVYDIDYSNTEFGKQYANMIAPVIKRYGF